MSESTGTGPNASATRPTRRSGLLVLLVVVALSGTYASLFMYRGWIAHDDGTIAQSAERVLNGEMPHRDFDDTYTGGLTYLHAAAMKLAGVNLRAPRLALLVFFVAFVAAVFGVARWFGSVTTAILATALGVAWTVPNYFVSLPSWYNLFFATFGVLAFLRFLDGRSRVWIGVAGLCGGLSMLAKIPGLFYLGGGLLFLAYVEHLDAITGASPHQRRSRFWLVLAIPVGLALAALAIVLSSQSSSAVLVDFFVPVLLVSGFVVLREWQEGVGPIRERVLKLFGLVWPFLVGAAIPVGLFVVMFWRHGAVADLLRGVFVLPQRRLTEASLSPPAVGTLGLALPYALLLLWQPRRAVRRQCLLATGLAAVLAVGLAFGYHPVIYRAIWAVARSLPLIASVAGVRMLWPSGGANSLPLRTRAPLFLIVAMAAMVALVQFPYATPTYFFYVAPLVGLAIAAIVSSQPRAPQLIHASVGAFFLGFALIFLNQSYGWNLGVQFIPYHPQSLLDLDRGGLIVPDDDKRDYEEIVRALRSRVTNGTIFAGPDCPEVYFLSGFKNPTRAIFDFLSPEIEDEAWMKTLLTRAPIQAAVINTAPLFSPRLEPRVLALLEQRFPVTQEIGRFVVRFEAR